MAAVGHLVVGIGASAGGLQALKALLAGLPADAALAIVVAQHGSADDRELFSSALAPFSPLPVVPVGEGVPLLPGRLHVAVGADLFGLRHDRLHVRAPRAAERKGTIDSLFQALAEAYGRSAVAVVLSGTGSDGALGLEAVATAGGMALAQEPASAAHPEMPESAIATGCVDIVQPPGELARTLLAYARHLRGAGAEQAPGAFEREIEACLPQIAEALHERTGHDFKHYKAGMMARRVRRRMQVLRVGEPGAYAALLEREPQEAQALFRDLLIGVTSFFRDPEAFAALGEQALGPLLAGAAGGGPVRIWVPGCATGEEAYSIAMLIRERLDRMEAPPEVQIFATDANERALAVARRGSYPLGIAEQVPPARLQRFFVKQGRRWQVSRELRAMCLFAAHNLIADPPYLRQDLISCRNLLIYLGPHLQKKLISLFHYALRPGGYLFLGASEALSGHGELFRAVDARHRIAQRKDTKIRIPGQLGAAGRALPAGARAAAPASDPHDLGAVAQRILLDEFAPAYVLVDEEGQVAYRSEGVGKYLQTPPGPFTSSVLRMARKGLGAGLRAALAEAARRRRTVARSIASVETSEGPRAVRLTAQPMPELGQGGGLYMLVFQDQGPASWRGGAEGRPHPDADTLVEQLERELLRTREDLERTVQQLEQANEELQSSNEEFRSINEELQAANEELEASKEEVQAANRALAAANADLENLLRSTQIATIFLDREGHIRSFTPAASAIWNITAGDVGRPLAHFTHHLRELPPLPGPESLAPGEVAEATVEALDGRWFLRRALAYRTADGTSDGLLVTFVDITLQKRAEQALRDSEARFRLMAETVPDIVWTAAADGTITYANDRWFRYCGIEPDRNAREWPELVLHPDDRARCLEQWGRALREGTPYEIEVRNRRFDGAYRWFLTRAVPVRDQEGRVAAWFGATTDIHEHKLAEAALAASEERFRRAIDATGALVYDLDLRPGGAAIAHGLERIVGLQPEGAGLTGDWWHRLIHPEDLPGYLAERERHLAARGVSRTAYRVRHADGSWRHVEESSEVVASADGAPARLVCAIVDVTERERAEEHQRLLLAELNHRVKNTLALVGAIARQTAGRATGVAGYVEAFSGRLAALAAAHDLLTATGWRGVSLKALAERVLQPYQGPKAARLAIRAEELLLRPAVAQNLALALHELATNAVKHGALSAARGRVELTAGAANGADGELLELVWREQGGPGVAPPQRHGFGSLLLQQVIVRQHRGRAELDWRAEGLVCRLALPLAQAVELAPAAAGA